MNVSTNAGSTDESNPKPIPTPHIGAPTPQTCSADIPIMLATIPNIECLEECAAFTFSFIPLTKHVSVKAKTIIKI